MLSLVLASAFTACNKQESESESTTGDRQLDRRRTSLRRRIHGQGQSAGAATSAADGSSAHSADGANLHHRLPHRLVVPAGTSLVVRMGNTIDTKTAHDGDSFTGTLAHSVAVDGVVAIPSGAGVAGTVVDPNLLAVSKAKARFRSL